MKTAEEQYQEAIDFIDQYEYETGFKFLPELLVRFANAKAKAVLEEKMKEVKELVDKIPNNNEAFYQLCKLQKYLDAQLPKEETK